MTTIHPHFHSPRENLSLCSEKCQTILYKSALEHFTDPRHIAALLLAAKSFQNSSFGANFLHNFPVDSDTIPLFTTVLSPSATSCFTLQFAPSLNIRNGMFAPSAVEKKLSTFAAEIANTKYLRLQLRCLTLVDVVTAKVVISFFGNSVEFRGLRSLSLHCIERLGDDVLNIVVHSAPHLSHLSLLGSSGFTAKGLEHVGSTLNTSITSLDFYCCLGIDDACMAHITELPNLSTINLTGCSSITDVGLKHFSTLHSMTSLQLGACSHITDRGLEHLSKLENLRFLDLNWCNLITAVGLEHISKLSGIISLDISYCSISEDAAQMFKQSFPNCTVEAKK